MMSNGTNSLLSPKDCTPTQVTSVHKIGHWKPVVLRTARPALWNPAYSLWLMAGIACWQRCPLPPVSSELLVQ